MNTTTLLTIIFVPLAFGVGFGLIPLLAMTRLAPAIIAEPLANGLLTVVAKAKGGLLLRLDESGEYVLEEIPEDAEPVSCISRAFGGRFGVTYDRTAEAWEGLAERVEPEGYVADGGLPGTKVERRDSRAGHRSFIDIDRDRDSSLFVRWGEMFSRLRDGGGLDAVNRAENQGLKEHGGDSSEFSAKTMLAGSVIFAMMGLASGYFVFFA